MQGCVRWIVVPGSGSDHHMLLRLSVLRMCTEQLLENPHAENPLEPDIATLLNSDKKQFEKNAKKYTAEFASS